MKPTKNNPVLVVTKGQGCGEKRPVTVEGLGGDGHIHSIAFFPGAHLDTEGRHSECHRAPYRAISVLSVVVAGGIPQDP